MTHPQIMTSVFTKSTGADTGEAETENTGLNESIMYVSVEVKEKQSSCGVM